MYVKHKLHETLLHVLLGLVRMGGAIAIQKGPTDAQLLLIKELIGLQYSPEDLGVSMDIIEAICKCPRLINSRLLTYSHVSFRPPQRSAILLQYHNSHNEKITCVRTPDSQPTATHATYGSLFSTVLGTEGRHNHVPPNLSMLLSLLQLCAKLIEATAKNSDATAAADQGQTAAPATDPATMMSADDYEVAGLTANDKQQQQHADEKMDADESMPLSSAPNIADNVLHHQATMTRLLAALTQSTNSSFSLLVASFSTDDDVNGEGTNKSVGETSTEAGKTVAALHAQYLGGPSLQSNAEPASLSDAVFDVLILLGRRASKATLMIQPIVEYLKQSECDV